MRLNALLWGNNYRECINETKLSCSDDSAVMLECIVCEHNTQTLCALVNALCVNTTHKQCVPWSMHCV